MATDLRSDPELARLVEQARARAAEAGELLAAPMSIESPLSDEARQIVASWLAEGGYARAVAVVEAEDPELRTE
jgi:hypothetical protein